MMGVEKRTSRWVINFIGFVAVAIAGCTDVGTLPGGVPGGLFASLSNAADPPPDTDESNDSFAEASPLSFQTGLPRVTEGTIHSQSDVDIYHLGPVFAGERVDVSVTGNGWLDAVAAVFDTNGNLVYLNDDRNFFSNVFDPRLSFVLRRGIESCYLAVASSPMSGSRGAYRLELTVFESGGLMQPNSQSVLLNFEGARGVMFAGRAAVDMSAFDASRISDSLTGLTDALIARVVELVRADFDGLDVDIASSREKIDVDARYTTIHFGAYDRQLLGIAENVDEFNERQVQEAIVFTDTFEVFEVLSPTLDEYAQALANVASHEIGHLLGLVHTSDVMGLMDITASLRQLTRNQAFSVSALDHTIMPVGVQDAPALLIDGVGGDLAALRRQVEAQIRSTTLLRGKSSVDTRQPAARTRAVLSSCCLGHSH